MRIPEVEVKSGSSCTLRGRPQTSLQAHHLVVRAHAAAHGHCEGYKHRLGNHIPQNKELKSYSVYFFVISLLIYIYIYIHTHTQSFKKKVMLFKNYLMLIKAELIWSQSQKQKYCETFEYTLKSNLFLWCSRNNSNIIFYYQCWTLLGCCVVCVCIYCHVKKLGHPIEFHGFLYQEMIKKWSGPWKDNLVIQFGNKDSDEQYHMTYYTVSLFI